MLGARSLALALALGATVGTACGGEIEFGTALDGRADAGVAADAGQTADAGLPLDAGLGPADGGPRCPPAWPYARDKATYRAKFYDWVVAQPPLRCNSNVCHGGPQAPLIPPAETDLDQPATLSAAIDALWATIPPTLQREGVTASGLSYRHQALAAGGGGAGPSFSPEQQAFVDALVRSSCP